MNIPDFSTVFCKASRLACDSTWSFSQWGVWVMLESIFLMVSS